MPFRSRRCRRPETGEPGDPNTAKPNGIAANMVLYAFLEDATSQMPVAYLGEFKVTEAQPRHECDAAADACRWRWMPSSSS